MTDGIIFDYLKERHGIEAPRPYYAVIEEWDAWRRGFWRPFHEFTESSAGGRPIKRELYRLNMAKKICEDWASLLLGERTVINAADNGTSEWLFGTDGCAGVVGDCGLLRQLGRVCERVFALGTGAAILRLDGVELEDGRLRPTPAAKMHVDFVDAAHIVPISTDCHGVYEAAFISESRHRGRELCYIELHRLAEDGYVITNEWLELRDGKLCECEPDRPIAREIRTGSRTPLFALLTPNIENHIDERCGLGVSVYSQAIDCLKGVDLAFNNFCRDLKLGGKKVFMNRSLVMRDENGTMYTPDDVAQQLFVTIGDGELSSDTMICEHNPELRTEENADAVQHQLDYLSFRCGLGTRHYLFSGVQGKAQLTATQYTGERQDLIQNTAKHRINVEDFLRRILRAMLWAGHDVLMLRVDPETELTVRFDDSYFIDSESERTRDRAEVEAGLMRPFEYRMKWRGESRETAISMTAASDGGGGVH